MGAARGRKQTSETRITGQPAYVLHSYPYKETSLILDVFSRDHGRVPLVAKGAKRPHSVLRPVLTGFQLLSLGWTGKSELRTLTGAEWIGGLAPVDGAKLFPGYYVNELMRRALARDDPHPGLFEAYMRTLARLAGEEPVHAVLRAFELALLRETGHGADLSRCALTGAAIDPHKVYTVDPERGAVPAPEPSPGVRVRGQTLIDMAAGQYSGDETRRESAAITGALLAWHLGDAPLHTRSLLAAMGTGVAGLN